MNANKKNSGWILRPSKTFPGKFYYFNVLNGDTAWSLEDTEKKDGGSPKVLDIHDHPEPVSPPPADVTQPNYSLTRYPFSQSATKTLQSTPEELNVVWTPIQIQVPIVITPKSRMPNQVSEPRINTVKVQPQFDVEKVQPKFDMEKCQYKDKLRVEPKCFMEKMKIQPQTTKKQILEPCKELFVHALPKPLCQRFLNYETPMISFNKDNKIDKLYTSTPIKNPPNPMFKTIASNTDLSFDNLEKSKDLVNEVPSKNPNPKVFEENELEECEHKDDSNKADLRLVLQAKKRKSRNLEPNTNTEKIESKKIKTVRQEVPSKPKKRVTFEMDFESSSTIIDNEYDDEDMNFKDKYAITIQSLKSVARPGLRDDYWYIVVDTEVLLEEFSFLDDFVKIDPSCKLMIPRSVMDEVSALSRGICRGRERVTQARNIVRKVPGQHIIVPSANTEEIKSPLNDAILKSCVEAIDKQFHLILITNDEQLLRTARCYPIQCYNIKEIKTDLASEPKSIKHQNTKLSEFTQSGTAVNSIRSNLFKDLNDKENEKIIRFKKNEAESRGLIEKTVITHETSIISKQNSRVFGENSKFTNKTSLFSNDCSRISNQNSMIPNINSMDINSNEDTMISIEHSTIASINAYPNSTKDDTNSWKSNVNSTVFTKQLTSERCTNNSHEKSLIFDGKPTSKENSYSKFERERETNKIKEPQCFEMEKDSRFKFEFGKEKNGFETNKTKEAQMINPYSKFETDVFKKPQCTALKKNNSMVDLREFYVKSKIMENRLKERMDEFICVFTQVMEDTLSGVLEKLSPSVLKAMPPPWSFFEALQSVKNIYKDHSLVRSIVQELCTALYEKDVRGMDKIKKNVNPNEYMKALGCGIHLIQYLKNILPHPEELTSTEDCLLNMLKSIEDPTSDVIEHLVKLPAVSSYDDIEVKHNFVKNRSEIVNYLKKHYPEWQTYDNCNMKIVRTYGKDLKLLKLDKKVIVDSEDNVATRNVDFTTKNPDVATKNADGVTRNVEFTTNKFANGSNDTETQKRVKITMKNPGYVEKNYTKAELLKTKHDHPKITENFNKNTEKITELPTLRSFKNKIDIEKEQPRLRNENKINGPRIIRNMQILEKFENILKRKKLDADIYNQGSDDDITYYSNDNKFKNYVNDSKYLKKNDSNKLNKKYEDKKMKGTDLKSQRKSDDSTNDSGIGNESPEIYSVVTKFSSKLSGSLEKIRGFLDGTFQEFNGGRLRNKTKKLFRLKAFETNFMITKIITGLNKVICSKNGRSKVSDKKHRTSEQLGKNKEVIFRCIKLAQMLQKTLNVILSIPNEDELNSSMSLNVSS